MDRSLPAPAAKTKPILQVQDLQVYYGESHALQGVSLTLDRGVLSVVGRNGMGKTTLCNAIVGLMPVRAGAIRFEGRDLLSLSVPQMRSVRGARIGMIFQEPQTSLNPVTTVGDQVTEAIRLHSPISSGEARKSVVGLFAQVGIPDPASRFEAYPHQLSGGLKQRIMIAMAMALRPRLLIADEPTTALDATIRAQILELLRNLSATTGTAVLLITHDFGVVNEVADRVAVMYAGQIVEEGTRSELLARPHHPYAQCLLRSIPRPEARGHRLEEIKGGVPRPGHWPAQSCRCRGCARRGRERQRRASRRWRDRPRLSPSPRRPPAAPSAARDRGRSKRAAKLLMTSMLISCAARRRRGLVAIVRSGEVLMEPGGAPSELSLPPTGVGQASFIVPQSKPRCARLSGPNFLMTSPG